MLKKAGIGVVGATLHKKWKTSDCRIKTNNENGAGQAVEIYVDLET